MIVEKFEKRTVSQTGREFVVGNVIESKSSIVRACYVNDIKCEACQDLLDLNPWEKVMISAVVGKGGPSLRVLSSAVVSKV